jgi:type I restriction enzyme S subunit
VLRGEIKGRVFASYLIRVRTNDSLLLPEFASDFISTGIGRLQIDRLSRQIIGMTNINAEEIRELRIPLPPIDKQHELVAAMDAARLERQEKLTQADALLARVDDFLFNALGLSPPASDSRRVFAIPTGQPRVQGRLNPDYYHPERMLALRALDAASASVRICGKRFPKRFRPYWKTI